MQRIARQNNRKCRLVRMAEEQTVPPPESFSHIILSGSEASAMEEQPWDKTLTDTIRFAMDHGKPFLGICYGHQFLARVLCGRSSVRKAAAPELGWTRVRVHNPENTLFAGAREWVTMVSHYDEVFGETAEKELTILASSPACRIHAFQYRELPIWGIQFHPEQDSDGAEQILTLIAVNDPQAKIDRTWQSEFSQEGNDRIFRNFFDRT